MDEGQAAWCEWTREGQHNNFGTVPLLSLDGFTDLVFQRLAVRD